MNRSRVLAVAAVLLLTTTGCPGRPGDTRDCEDFEYQQDAQDFYDRSHSQDDPDPHHLDSDGDGYACPRLPDDPDR